jgi:hypothetical protein
MTTTGYLCRRRGTALLGAASCLLLVLAAAQGYVSFRAQYTFVDNAKHARLPSVLEALGLDTGAVIFALLALSLARLGRRATVERFLNVACALGSLFMNLLAADLTSPRSITVWVLPSVLYALASDRLIAVVRRWVLSGDNGGAVAQEGSAWRSFSGLGLWGLRLVFDVAGTLAGFRRWILAVAPVAPGARAETQLAASDMKALQPGGDSGQTEGAADRPAERDAIDNTTQQEQPGVGESPALDERPSGELARGEKKREALIRLYERCGKDGDPRYGDRARAAALAGELANRIGYHPGTARRELAKYLAAQSQTSPGPEPATDAKAVA